MGTYIMHDGCSSSRLGNCFPLLCFGFNTFIIFCVQVAIVAVEGIPVVMRAMEAHSDVQNVELTASGALEILDGQRNQ